MYKQLSVIAISYFSLSFCIFTEIKPSAEADMAFIEMVRYHGYPVWSKFIDTPDGYTLNIFRIPGPKGESLSSAFTSV